MSLFESGHSTGDVSFANLVTNRKAAGRDNGMDVPQLMQRVVVGGWPDLLDASENDARAWLAGYLTQIVEVDNPAIMGRRDPRTLRRILESLARFVGQSPTVRSIGADAGGDRGPTPPRTLYGHLDALERLHLLDNSEAWRPHMRSRTRLRTSPTRYFVDPSIGAAALGIGSSELLGDLETAGFYFESMVVRDLRVYAERLGGRVDTWRDANGNEVDAVVTLPGGRWVGVEIKMSQRAVDKAAQKLLKLAERVDTNRQGPPAALLVITATGAAGTRPDGVNVVPITALGP